MKRAVLLDRDGTVIVERHYLSNPKEVELIAGVGAALRELREMGLVVALVTNQSAIGRGFFDLRRLKEIHGRLQELLDAEGVGLDGIYFCPHTPDDGCSCRKPKIGLLEEAAKALQVDPHDCFVIGDKLCDMEAGRRIGATTLLVRTGYGTEVAAAQRDCADHIVNDMKEAVSIIGRLAVDAEQMTPRVRLIPSTTDVVILCGGPGTRLGSLTAKTPKPLLPVGGQPFLLHLLLHVQQEGFTRVILAVQYLASQFRTFLTDYQPMVPNTALKLIVEPRPLGTGGALQYAARYVQSAAFVAMNGDSWVSQSLAPVLRDHERMGRHCTAVAVEASQVEGGAFSKGVWEATPKLSVTGFTTETRVTGGWVNAGIYVLDRAMVSSWPEGSYRLEDEFLSLLRGRKAGIFQSSGRLLDIGTPACYERASRILSVPVQGSLHDSSRGRLHEAKVG